MHSWVLSLSRIIGNLVSETHCSSTHETVQPSRMVVVLPYLVVNKRSCIIFCKHLSHPDFFVNSFRFGRAWLLLLEAKAWICLCSLLPSKFKWVQFCKSIGTSSTTCAVQQWPLIHLWPFNSTQIWLSSSGALCRQDAAQKLENVFARPFLSHCGVCFGAQILVEMDGCNQMKVIVAHPRIWSMHPRCQQEPQPTDFH